MGLHDIETVNQKEEYFIVDLLFSPWLLFYFSLLCWVYYILKIY